MATIGTIFRMWDDPRRSAHRAYLTAMVERDDVRCMRVAGLDLPPPSCLASIRTTRLAGDVRRAIVSLFISDEDDAKRLEWHRSLGRTEETWLSTRDQLEAWALGCPCGEDKAKIFGVRVGDSFSAPVFFACTACNVRTLVFDPSLHGYNAKISKKKRKARKAADATMAMHCRACKTTVWHPAMLVTYQGDADNYEEVPGKAFDPLADCFDVAVLGGSCATCGKLALFYDAECA